MSREILFRDSSAGLLVHCGWSHGKRKHEEEHNDNMRHEIFTRERIINLLLRCVCVCVGPQLRVCAWMEYAFYLNTCQQE